MPTHSHTITDPGHTHSNTLTDPGHGHTFNSNGAYWFGGGTGGLGFASGGYYMGPTPGPTNSNSSTGISITNAKAFTGISGTNSTGSNVAFSIIPQNTLINHIIKY